jgi:hypothetical protein
VGIKLIKIIYIYGGGIIGSSLNFAMGMGICVKVPFAKFKLDPIIPTP